MLSGLSRELLPRGNLHIQQNYGGAGLNRDGYTALSGIEQLRALQAEGKISGMSESLRFRLAELEEGRVVFEGDPGAHAFNPMGTVHGGYAATLLDSACGCAVHSKLDATQAYATLDLKVAYHKAMTDRIGTVRAEGRIVTFGRRAAFCEATLTDKAGKLYASATSTLLVYER